MQQYQAHAERVTAFKAVTPDFDAVAAASLEKLRGDDGSEPAMSPALVVAIERSPHGPTLFYNLVQDTAEFHRINALPQGEMWIALGELQATLKQQGKITGSKTAPGSTTAAAPPSDPAARAVDALTSSSTSAAPVSKAPAPPTLVGGSPTASTVSPEEEDYRTYADRRNEQEQRTRRR
jgi:hypothetical protein